MGVCGWQGVSQRFASQHPGSMQSDPDIYGSTRSCCLRDRNVVYNADELLPAFWLRNPQQSWDTTSETIARQGRLQLTLFYVTATCSACRHRPLVL